MYFMILSFDIQKKITTNIFIIMTLIKNDLLSYSRGHRCGSNAWRGDVILPIQSHTQNLSYSCR